MTTKLRLLAVFALVLALALASGCSTRVVTAEPGGALHTVTASGSGRVAATPDEATMSFGVVRRSSDAKKALSDASAAAEKITAALKKQGVAEEDIQTAGVNVFPQYAENGGKTTVTGYEASINVTAKVKDLEKLGAIITALSQAGADNVSGPSFGISEDQSYRADAIREAVDDARDQAEEMADAAGKNLGDVVSITNSAVNVPGPLAWGAARTESMDAAAAVPIEPGQLEVTADLTVVFELK